MSKKRTTKEVRKKLETIGVFIPRGMNMFHINGDTFHLIGWQPGWEQPAAAKIRQHGYFARLIQLPDSDVFCMIINLYGTEWQDGLIPENLAGLPLREEADTQPPLF